jgi:hypothetical protein
MWLTSGSPAVLSRQMLGRSMVGVGLVNGFGVGLAFLVLGERPVDAGQAGVAAFTFAGGDDQVEADVVERLAVRATAQQGVQSRPTRAWPPCQPAARER